MRVELENRGADRLFVRIGKEKHGRVTQPRQVSLTRPGALPISNLREATS
jgi:hypothetical protein